MASKKISFPLHWRIILALFLGILWGLYAANESWGPQLTTHYIKPFGTIFIRLLQMVAVPLVLASLISGVARLRDVSKLARIGGKTILLFICTAFISTTIGILTANISDPGKTISSDTREMLLSANKSKTESTIGRASEIQSAPLSTFVDMFPDNVFGAASDNGKMIQVVFFALLFGVAVTRIKDSQSSVIIQFFEAINEALIKLVGMLMQFAPIGVFALMAGTMVEVSGDAAVEVLLSMLTYGLTVIAGLAAVLFVVYPILFTSFSKIKYLQFFREMRPAFLLGFSTSSSNATLPVTMERVEKHLKVPEEITGFVLPFGTTINMDGTALYQSVAAVFIAQAFGIELSLLQMAAVVLTATVAAAGAAGVPGAGMITLVIVLNSIGVPAAGIALIMAPDRILDMCRTVVNVAGDAVAAIVVAGTEKS